jgi:hypothetical protein
MVNIFNNKTNKKQIQQPSGFQELALGEIDKTWKKHDLTSAPILLKNKKGEYEKSKYKIIMVGNEIASIVTNRYLLLANEEAIKLVSDAVKQTKLKLHQKHIDDKRVYMYWLHPKTYQIGKDKSKVQLGLCMKNSINGTLGFSLSLWSFRQVCGNGAVVASSELASISKRHTGKEIIPAVGYVKDSIDTLFDSGRSLIEEYQAMEKTKLNESIAYQLAVKQRIPRHWLPDYIKVSKGKVEIEESPDCWKVFNDISQTIWHNKKTNHGTVCQYTELLHRAIINGIRMG